MDGQKKLIRDVLIIGTILFIGALFYIFVPRSPDTEQGVKEKNLTTTQPTMTQEEKEGKLKIEIIKQGTGDEAKNGQIVHVDYTGMLTDGSVFDSSIPRGQSFPFTLGAGEVIKGWDIGILGMKVGEQRRLTIDPELAYGPNGFPPVIPPNAVLIFDVELKGIGNN